MTTVKQEEQAPKTFAFPMPCLNRLEPLETAALVVCVLRYCKHGGCGRGVRAESVYIRRVVPSSDAPPKVGAAKFQVVLAFCGMPSLGHKRRGLVGSGREGKGVCRPKR